MTRRVERGRAMLRRDEVGAGGIPRAT
jgi:hypothetical protein